MIALSGKNINKSFGTNTIINEVTFHINEGEKVGLVGPNGAGKSTLLKIMSGRMDYDSGEVFARSEIGYLSQNPEFNSEHTVYECAEQVYHELVKQGEEDIYESMIEGILKNMGFGESFFNKKTAILSGGEKTRLALAMLLLRKPKIMLLDEPTNHLDLGTLAWLENHLKSYNGTIVVVSHDRYFLDEVVGHIFDLEKSRLHVYKGNYTKYAEKKRLARENELFLFEKQDKEIKRQEEIIRRFKQHGTEKLVKRAQSREKRLAQLTPLEKPDGPRANIKIHFKQRFKSGNDVLQGENLSKSFGTKQLFSRVSFDIKKGEKIAMVGANGIGKTTLLKIIDGETEPSSGELKLGHNVDIAYYDQEQAGFDLNNTLLDELTTAYRLYSDTEMRKILGRFLFFGDTVFQKISSLSGGEKARLALLKLMLTGANTLLLDEPTNHLDIDSKEIFEDALLDYPGTVLAISHDRYFLRKIPNRIVELEKDGLVNYLGSFDYYTEKKRSLKNNRTAENYLKNLVDASDTTSEASSSAKERLLKKQAQTEKKRREKQIANLEQKIHELEESILKTEEEMCKEENLKDHVKLAEMALKIEKDKEVLDITYEEWHNLI